MKYRTDAAHLTARHRALSQRLGGRPALLAAGLPSPRNFAANPHPFRASSHFLYMTGASLPGAFFLLAEGRARLFVPAPGPDHDLWHGPSPGLDALAASTGCEVAHLDALADALAGLEVAALPTADLRGCHELSARLSRPIAPGQLAAQDEPLAEAIIACRLAHDDHSLEETAQAVEATAEAFAAGMAATAPGLPEWAVRAAMVERLGARGMVPSYNPIVSVHGEVLHNESSDGQMRDGDLLLVDFGGESRGGWACDVTRTWPVSGTLSPTQRDLYDVVLAAERAAIAAVAPGVRYRDIHMIAARTIAEGLVALGILRGDVEELVADGVHALFFPHGVGHLLGLDVHDMEDLGDRAGYAPGRARSPQFGLGYLRLDRDLTPGTLVTIEPGFYQVPAILADPRLSALAGDRLDRDALARFSDVRGIRIEDNILVTADGHRNLTAAIPKAPEAMAELIGAR